MTWEPSSAVRAEGERVQRARLVPYVGGSRLTSEDRALIQLPPKPGTVALAQWVRERWGLGPVGTRRGAHMIRDARGADGRLRTRDLHEEGRALDAMTGSYAGAGRGIGDEIASILVRYAAPLGVQLVIWDHTEWGSGPRGGAWESYTGRDPHTNHVHAEQSPAWASDPARVRAALAAIDADAAPHGGVSGLARSLGVVPHGPGTPPAPAPPRPRTSPPRESPAPPVPVPPARSSGSGVGGVVLVAGVAAGLAWWLSK